MKDYVLLEGSTGNCPSEAIENSSFRVGQLWEVVSLEVRPDRGGLGAVPWTIKATLRPKEQGDGHP